MFTFACKTCHPWKCKKPEWCTQGVARNGWGVEAHMCCWSSWQKRDNVFHFEFTSDIMTRKILTSKDTLVSIIIPPLSYSGLHQHSKIRLIHIEHVKYTKQFKHYQDQDILRIPSPFVDNKWLMCPDVPVLSGRCWRVVLFLLRFWGFQELSWVRCHPRDNMRIRALKAR